MTSKPSSSSPVAKVERILCTGRTLFVACLLSTAVVIGWVAHYFLNASERDLARVHWEGIADRALSAALARLAQKRWDAVAFGSIIAETRPNATEWPNVCVPGFERIAQDFSRKSSSTVFNFAPLVLPDELLAWEDFAYQYLHVDRKPVPFASDAGVSAAGKGVWAYNRTHGELEPYLDRGGLEHLEWKSHYDVMFPVFASNRNDGPSGILMFNLHSVQLRGASLDEMLDCVENSQRNEPSAPSPYSLQDEIDLSCTTMSSKLGNRIRDTPQGPSVSIYQPIRPVSDLSKVSNLLLLLLLLLCARACAVSHDILVYHLQNNIVTYLHVGKRSRVLHDLLE